MTRAAWLAAFVVAGCLTPPASSEPDLARRSPVTAEVEIGGTVTRPPDTTGVATVWIVDAPCWQTGGHALSATRATDDKFLVQLYVAEGTRLWVCAALGDGGGPLTVYGKADGAPFIGKAAALTGLVVPLVQGKKVAAPARR